MREALAQHDTSFPHPLILIIPSHPWCAAISASGWREGEEECGNFFFIPSLGFLIYLEMGTLKNNRPPC